MNTPNTQKLYHGGGPGRVRGEMLKTSNEMGVRSPSGQFREYDGDRIYLTADPREAAFFAKAYFPPEHLPLFESQTQLTAEQKQQCGGAIYQVEAIGHLEDDPDSPVFGLWVQTSAARVAAVVAAKVEFGTGKILKSSTPALIGQTYGPTHLECT